jgi:hypothetical protein
MGFKQETALNRLLPVPVDETGATVEVGLLNVGFVDHQKLHDVQVGHEARGPNCKTRKLQNFLM